MIENEMGLYKLAKYTNLEIVMESQVQSSGGNQARLLEKYKKNKSSIKQQAIGMKIIFAAMLFFVAVLPITTIYFQVRIMLSNPFVIPDSLLIPGGILFGSFNIMQLLYLTMLGMFAIGAMMSGDAFRWYETLPLSKKKLRKLGFMTAFRNLDVGLITMMIAFPITIFVISLNILLTLVAAMISVINVLFSFSILVLIAGKISSVLKISEAGSRKATLIRIFTMLSYMVVIFSASFFLQWIITAANDFFNVMASLDIPLIINIIMSLIPYLFSSGYLMIMSMEPSSFTPILWVSALVGIGLSILITYFTYRRALRAMRSVTSSASLEAKQSSSSKKIPDEEPIEVQIEPRTPIKAYIRKDMATSTRDMQSFMFIIMPFVLPFMVIIPLLISPIGIGGSFLGDYVLVWAFLTMYQPMISMMLTSGFLNMEDTGASILSALPIRTRDQAKAKLLLLGSIQTMSFFLPLILFIGNPEFSSYLFSFISYYPVVLTLLISMFQMKIRFFGRMRYKFVVEEFNPEKKVTKWIIMGVVQYLIYFAFNLMGGILILFNANLMFIATFIGGILALGVLLLSFNNMFPKIPGKRQTISIREILRKHPLFGTVNLLVLYAGFLFLPGFIDLLFIFLIDISITAFLFIDFLVTFSVMALLWIFLVRRSLGLPNGKESLKEYIQTIGFKPDRKIIRNIFLGISCSIIYFISIYITGNIFGNYIFDLDVIFGTPGSSVSFFGWFFFIYMLIPGIWEEVSFRGVIMTMNMRKYSRTTVLIFVSILFGLFHLLNLIAGNNLVYTGVQVIYAALLGFLFGYLFIKTKSLIPSIILHYLIDSLGQLFTYLTFDSIVNLVLFAIIGVGLVPTVLGMLLVRMVVKKEPR